MKTVQATDIRQNGGAAYAATVRSEIDNMVPEAKRAALASLCGMLSQEDVTVEENASVRMIGRVIEAKMSLSAEMITILHDTYDTACEGAGVNPDFYVPSLQVIVDTGHKERSRTAEGTRRLQMSCEQITRAANGLAALIEAISEDHSAESEEGIARIVTDMQDLKGMLQNVADSPDDSTILHSLVL